MDLIQSVREALVNALIHRDYQVVGSEIHVDGYEYPFNRNSVADSFGVRMSYASDLINRMVKGGLVRKEKRGVYYFTK